MIQHSIRRDVRPVASRSVRFPAVLIRGTRYTLSCLFHFGFKRYTLSDDMGIHLFDLILGFIAADHIRKQHLLRLFSRANIDDSLYLRNKQKTDTLNLMNQALLGVGGGGGRREAVHGRHAWYLPLRLPLWR